jgi:hypothetical protein
MKNIIPYISQSGDIQLDVMLQDDNAWITQKQLAELFGVTKQQISLHLINIFESEELDENSVVKFFLTTATDGKSYNTKHYNLDVLISLGFRVHSKKAIEFRKWANPIVKDYSTKGIAINEKLLSESPQLLAKAEKTLYMIKGEAQNLSKMCADIMALSIDYEKSSPYAIDFFKKVNAKFCYAVTGNTPSEVKYYRANGTKPNMNATAFKGNKITKTEAKSARSYLSEQEYDFFCTLIASLFNKCKLDTMRGERFYMKDWLDKIDELLLFHKFPILKDGGRITSLIADKYIDTQYSIFTGKSIPK